MITEHEGYLVETDDGRWAAYVEDRCVGTYDTTELAWEAVEDHFDRIFMSFTIRGASGDRRGAGIGYGHDTDDDGEDDPVGL